MFYLIYQDRIYNPEGYIFEKFFYYKEFMGWTSGFPKITVTLSAHWEEMKRWTEVIGDWSGGFMSLSAVFQS